MHIYHIISQIKYQSCYMSCSHGGSRHNRVHRQPSHWIYAGKVHWQPCYQIILLGIRPERMSATVTNMHHISSCLYHVSSCLYHVLFFYMQHWCRSDLGHQPTWPASRELTWSGYTQSSYTCHRISKVKYTNVPYKYRPEKGKNNISFWSFLLKTIKGSQPWSFINLRKSG